MLEELPDFSLIYLEEKFRRKMILDGIRKAGSMRQLGRIMGYGGNAPNWSIKLMLSGKQGIPLFRLKALCEFLDLDLKEIEKHIVKIKR